jgi:hypothetical protein
VRAGGGGGLRVSARAMIEARARDVMNEHLTLIGTLQTASSLRLGALNFQRCNEKMLYTL